ncbi:uncharacterized protein isoform X2 [Choristoneura fumiferana]|uniref:uncharacterized protein isoform X2 n=1 Tax=Choristoneura fumiferana TaxID=7141 RepID=UPI003D15472C
MSATSATEGGEELKNVPLVRMEDVQTPKERDSPTEILETCIVDSVDYDDCVVNDEEDSNIGSMVSIQSEEVVEEDSDSAEMIVPEVLEPLDEIPIDVPEQKHSDARLNPPDSWPTLEILPGGVIKHGDKCEEDIRSYSDVANKPDKNGEMMYACAKCSESFKYLFSLVKHVRWHEDEKKKEKGPDMTKLTNRKKHICLHSGKKKVIQRSKKSTKKS